MTDGTHVDRREMDVQVVGTKCTVLAVRIRWSAFECSANQEVARPKREREILLNECVVFTHLNGVHSSAANSVVSSGSESASLIASAWSPHYLARQALLRGARKPITKRSPSLRFAALLVHKQCRHYDSSLCTSPAASDRW